LKCEAIISDVHDFTKLNLEPRLKIEIKTHSSNIWKKTGVFTITSDIHQKIPQNTKYTKIMWKRGTHRHYTSRQILQAINCPIFFKQDDMNKAGTLHDDFCNNDRNSKPEDHQKSAVYHLSE